MNALEELVARLEQLVFTDHLEDAEWLAEALGERQIIVTAIQNTDMASLPAELNASIQQRIRAVLVRDAQVIEQLQLRMAETKKELEQLAPGRAALRGYGETVAVHLPSLHRIG
jgi:hypothetical protein